MDAEGDVVGYECEAQEGMHIREEYAAGCSRAKWSRSCASAGGRVRGLMPAGESRLTGAFEGAMAG